MKKWTVFLGTFLVLGTLSFAQDVKTLAFAEEVGWPPFTSAQAGIASDGLSFDVITEVGKRLGVAVTLESMPFARVVSLNQSGAKDGITAVSKNPEREQFLLFSTPWVDKVGSLYVLKGKEAAVNFRTAEDLKGHTVGIVRGNSYGAEIDRAIQAGTLKVEESADHITAFRKLLAGRCDVLLAVNIVASEFLKQPEFSGKISALSQSYLRSTYSIALAKKSPAAGMLPKINQALEAMRADGTLRKILTKYGL